MTEFKIGDKVFRKIDPEWTTTGEGAIECTIIALLIEKTEGGQSIKEYEIRYNTFDEDSFIKSDRIFGTKEEALFSLKKDVSNKIEKLEKKLKMYKDLFPNS